VLNMSTASSDERERSPCRFPKSWASVDYFKLIEQLVEQLNRNDNYRVKVWIFMLIRKIQSTDGMFPNLERMT